MQAPEGGAVYLRLSTRPVDQPKRTLSPGLREAIIAGGYWLSPPAPGAELAIVCQGAVVPEAAAAHQEILEDIPGAGLLVVTSGDWLHQDWLAAKRAHTTAHVEGLLKPLAADAALVTVLDAHPATLSWLGAVKRHRVEPLGVEHFGQSGDIPDLYRVYGIDAEAILDAAARACLSRG